MVPDTRAPAAREACILFLHHRNDPVTRLHYEILAQTGYTVIPLVDGTDAFLPGTCDVSALDSRDAWDVDNKWAAIDTWVYRWFEHRTVTARRYIIAEWDCLLIGSIREFYGRHWDDDFACNYLKLVTDDWYWFRYTRRTIPDHLNQGVVPFAGCIVQHDALARIVEKSRDPMLHNVFCENRIAVAAALAGVPITAMKKDGTLNASQKVDHPRCCGFYHSVKKLAQEYVPSRFDMT